MRNEQWTSPQKIPGTYPRWLIINWCGKMLGGHPSQLGWRNYTCTDTCLLWARNTTTQSWYRYTPHTSTVATVRSSFSSAIQLLEKGTSTTSYHYTWWKRVQSQGDSHGNKWQFYGYEAIVSGSGTCRGCADSAHQNFAMQLSIWPEL